MKNNLFANIPNDLPNELFECLASSDSDQVKIERIISRGHTTPAGEWYDQAWHEWVILLQGEASLEFEQQADPVHLKKGDYLLIKAHQKHRVSFTSSDEEVVWLAVHFR